MPACPAAECGPFFQAERKALKSVALFTDANWESKTEEVLCDNQQSPSDLTPPPPSYFLLAWLSVLRLSPLSKGGALLPFRLAARNGPVRAALSGRICRCRRRTLKMNGDVGGGMRERVGV